MPRERLSSPTSSLSEDDPPSEDRSVSVAPAECRTLVLTRDGERVLKSSGRGPAFRDPDDGVARLEGRVDGDDKDLSWGSTASGSFFHESRTMVGPSSSEKFSSGRS